MNSSRLSFCALALVLVCGPAVSAAAQGWSQPVASGATSPSALKTRRDAYATVSLTDTSGNANVYYAGGRTFTNGSYTTNSSTEYYNTGSHSFASGPSMRYSRSYFPLIPLATGKLLAVGGFSASYGTFGTCELGATSGGKVSSWSSTGSLHAAREQFPGSLIQNSHTSQDGMALVSGGYNGNYNTVQNTAELYNPSTGKWSYTAGSMSHARFGHSQTTLPDGEVMVTGGRTSTSGSNANYSTASVEYYSPASGTWRTGAPLQHARFRHTLTALNSTYNGFPVLLVTGGFWTYPDGPPPAGVTGPWQTDDTIEIGVWDGVSQYNWSLLTDASSNLLHMSTPGTNDGSRMDHGAAQVAGRDEVLVVGGWDSLIPSLDNPVQSGRTIVSPVLISVQLNQTTGAASGSVTPEPVTFTTRHELINVTLPNGTVLVVGGLQWDAHNIASDQNSLGDAWIFTP